MTPEAQLDRYRAEHGISGVWETRERVVVALTGGTEGETLIRRAARIADRMKARFFDLRVFGDHLFRHAQAFSGCVHRRRRDHCFAPPEVCGDMAGRTGTTRSVSVSSAALPADAWTRLADRKPYLKHALK
jgi:hypothetical protein